MLALRWLIIGLFCTAATATAQDSHYRSVPIGERAIGMGGAFTAVADDPSAAYYNPAGLVLRNVDSLVGGLTIQAFGRLRIASGLSVPGATANIGRKKRIQVPSFVGAVKTFGRRSRNGSRPYAIGYSSLTLSRKKLLFDTQIEGSDNTGSARVESDSTLDGHGISLAYRSRQGLAFGLTLYVASQHVVHREDLALSMGGTRVEDVVVGSEFSVSNSLAKISAYHFLLRAGIAKQMNPRLTLGWVVQVPGIPLKQRAKLRRQIARSDPSAAMTPTEFEIARRSGVDARLPIPFEIRTGLAFQANKRTLLAFDAALHGPTRGKKRIDTNDSLAIANQEIGVFFDRSSKRTLVGNIALGVERKFENVSLQCGAFTNLSAQPRIERRPDAYQSPRIHLFGVSSALSIHVGKFHIATGVTAQFGRGKATAVVGNETPNEFYYVRTNASERAIMVHVAGALSALVEAIETIEVVNPGK